MARRQFTVEHCATPRDVVRFVELLLSTGCTQFQVLDKRDAGSGRFDVAYLAEVQVQAA